MRYLVLLSVIGNVFLHLGKYDIHKTKEHIVVGRMNKSLRI